MKFWFCGDVHGDFSHVKKFIDVAKDTPFKPDIVIFLGDLECQMPFHMVVEAMDAPDVIFRFVTGNHDFDHDAFYDNVYSERNIKYCLDEKVIRIDDIFFSGLGGAFNGLIWFPKHEMDTNATFKSYDDVMHHMRNNAHLSKPQAERQRIIEEVSVAALGNVYPDKINKVIANGPANIFVTHDAPYCLGGSIAIEKVAETIGAKLIVCGHKHKDASRFIGKTGTACVSVGKRGIVCYDGIGVSTLRPGE